MIEREIIEADTFSATWNVLSLLDDYYEVDSQYLSYLTE
jgi:hypothetical protein